jgi:hypothetical protein
VSWVVKTMEKEEGDVTFMTGRVGEERGGKEMDECPLTSSPLLLSLWISPN